MISGNWITAEVHLLTTRTGSGFSPEMFVGRITLMKRPREFVSRRMKVYGLVRHTVFRPILSRAGEFHWEIRRIFQCLLIAWSSKVRCITDARKWYGRFRKPKATVTSAIDSDEL
jgi:hypothetical protein